jgi:hypothetical protein
MGKYVGLFGGPWDHLEYKPSSEALAETVRSSAKAGIMSDFIFQFLPG